MREQVYTIPDHPTFVADLPVSERALFLKRTYLHLFGAILAFIGLEVALFQTALPEAMFVFLQNGSWRWLLFLGGFMIVGTIASRAARSAKSSEVAYASLALYILIEGLIFVPLIWIANNFAPGALASAAVITLIGFTGLTAVVLITRKDFSFLRGIIGLGFILALLAIVGGAIFGFSLGLWFSIAMVALAGGAILYTTSEVMLHYPMNRHVSAALELFAAVALLFWYVLQILISLQSD